MIEVEYLILIAAPFPIIAVAGAPLTSKIRRELSVLFRRGLHVPPQASTFESFKVALVAICEGGPTAERQASFSYLLWVVTFPFPWAW